MLTALEQHFLVHHVGVLTAAERIIRARVRTVVLALLPMHDAWPDEEPADLIEWAERLS